MTVEEWDLTSRISPYLDRHMVFPLLEFIDTTLLPAGHVNYKASDIGAARLALLRPTHMVDYAMDTYKLVRGEGAAVPAEMQKQKDDVYQALEELKKTCAPLDKLCKNEEERVCFTSIEERRTCHLRHHLALVSQLSRWLLTFDPLFVFLFLVLYINC